MTLGDVLVLMVLGLIVGCIIGSIYRNKKKGKHPGCGCCPHAGQCHGGCPSGQR